MARQCSLRHEGMPQLRDQTGNTGTGSIISTAMVDSLGDVVCTCYLVRGPILPWDRVQYVTPEDEPSVYILNFEPFILSGR